VIWKRTDWILLEIPYVRPHHLRLNDLVPIRLTDKRANGKRAGNLKNCQFCFITAFSNYLNLKILIHSELFVYPNSALKSFSSIKLMFIDGVDDQSLP
jgi:hypothetical protein